MAKRVAAVAVNPVNGFGLFQYLELFLKMGSDTKFMRWLRQKRLKPIRVLRWWPMM